MTTLTIEYTLDLPYEIDETDQHDCKIECSFDGDDFIPVQIIFPHGTVDACNEPALFEVFKQRLIDDDKFQAWAWDALRDSGEAPRQRGYDRSYGT